MTSVPRPIPLKLLSKETSTTAQHILNPTATKNLSDLRILECASPIWVPYLQADISALEKVQRAAARYAVNNYSLRSSVLLSLDWPTLESCLYSKLDKIINGHIEPR